MKYINYVLDKIKKHRKKVLICISVLVLFYCIVLILNFKIRDKKALEISENSVELKQKKISNKKYDADIQINGVMPITPLLFDNSYDQYSKNNSEFNESLNYGAVQDMNGKNRIISIHNYHKSISKIANMNHEKIGSFMTGKIISIKNNKSKKLEEYKIYDVKIINDDEAEKIYAEKNISEDKAIMYTCLSKSRLLPFDTSLRLVFYAIKI